MKRAAFIPVVAVGLLAAAPQKRPTTIVTVRDRGCGCCEGWIAAARSAGYVDELQELDHAERLRRFHIDEALSSCHTSSVAGYLVEGHVPLAALAKLLRERPHTRGITVPGMPTGTPGMPGPKGPIRVVFLDAPEHVYYAE
jgi:hypothetical protein